MAPDCHAHSPKPMIFVSTWEDGLYVLEGGSRTHELAGRSVRSLAPDEKGGALAVVDGHELWRRAIGGTWTKLARADVTLACCMSVSGVVYAGTDDARVLQLGQGSSIGTSLDPLTGFETTPGRSAWYAGTAVVDGRVVGPPLGIRSMTATADGRALLANVHVGGIPRSTDQGATWLPTLEVESDVHEVRAHPERAEVVAAAAAVGLCFSRDGGSTWTIEPRGLHAIHGAAVAFAGPYVFLSTSESPFDPKGALYRRRIDEDGPLVRVGGGLPEWLEGGVDTGGLSGERDRLVLVSRSGSVHMSEDAGESWSCRAEGLVGASGVLLL